MISPIEMIKKQLMGGMTPQSILQKMNFGNNPMMNNLMEMQKKGDTKGIENFARNMFKEKGLNFDEEYAKFRNNFK